MNEIGKSGFCAAIERILAGSIASGTESSGSLALVVATICSFGLLRIYYIAKCKKTSRYGMCVF